MISLFPAVPLLAAACGGSASPGGVLEVLQGSSQLNVTSDSCAHSAALARIALPRL
jgi:hypothetical protein